MSTTFSLAQVAEHSQKKDIYVAIHNKVYNVTSFIEEHPGGEEVLLDEAGKDATEAFEDIGHSDEAREILENYYVADLDEAVSCLKRICLDRCSCNPRRTLRRLPSLVLLLSLNPLPPARKFDTNTFDFRVLNSNLSFAYSALRVVIPVLAVIGYLAYKYTGAQRA
ncbi:hypothetical protein INT44_007180 [Umbelopsis vinacea]|uniref:Cytochrome b5 heme-binding domain-containing protein n=1 Tax=Umbelopsis vinacea TaxID=44442 RepID=A0A8H7PM05_9FUNG|nr:hypothetical protein INT44_007180 [Umbelopsis vinacea]